MLSILGGFVLYHNDVRISALKSYCMMLCVIMYDIMYDLMLLLIK